MSEQQNSEIRNLIAERAYELYLQRGVGCGDEVSDWLRAEREVLASMSTPAPEPAVDKKVTIPAAPAGAGSVARRKTAAGTPRKRTGGAARTSKPKDESL